MTRPTLFLLFGLLPMLLFAQPKLEDTPSIRSSIETGLTEPFWGTGKRGSVYLYEQYIKFNGNLNKDDSESFTCIQKEDKNYIEYQVRLREVVGIDLVQLRDSCWGLALTFQRPITVKRRAYFDEVFARKRVEQQEEKRQVLILKSPESRSATQYLRDLFIGLNWYIYYRVRPQYEAKTLPLMLPVPNKQAALGKYAVTVDEYRRYCMDRNLDMPLPPKWGWHGNRAMSGTTWQEAQDYCHWLRETTGKPYRLPSKALWQYAAKGAKADGEEGLLSDVAWHGEIAEEVVQPVGQKQANSWGFYDMLGNVWEWLDAPLEDGQHMAAGGSCASHFEQCQWYSVVPIYAKEREYDVGFRVAL